MPRPSDLTLSVRQRKLACVLDPMLVLCHAKGTTLAQRLARVMEPWLTRSFWQVIDASDLLLSPRPAGPTRMPELPLHPSAAALSAWIAMREGTDAGSWPFRWVGDNLTESQVQGDADALVIERYEDLADALRRRLPLDEASPFGERRRPVWWDPLQLGGDAAALAGALDSALVLSCLPSEQDAPWPSKALHHAGLKPQRLEPMPVDSLFSAERSLVRDALAWAGLAPLVQQLPPLAVVQVALSPALAVDTGVGLLVPGVEDGLEPSDAADETRDPWAGALAWWYCV